MELSPRFKKNAHSVVMGFVTGGLSYLSGAIVSAPTVGWRAIAVGVVTAGASRLVGSLLAAIQTSGDEPPPDHP